MSGLTPTLDSRYRAALTHLRRARRAFRGLPVEGTSTLDEAIRAEQATLDALSEMYRAGSLEHCFFSPAYDVTAARLSALNLARGEQTEQSR